MLRYKLSRIAEEDLIRIYLYGVERFGVVQADKYYHKLFSCFEIIVQNPFSFEAVDYIKPGYRRYVCRPDSIYYKIENNVVKIMTIVGSQDLKNIF